MMEPKVVVLIFVSGKIVITGCKVRILLVAAAAAAAAAAAPLAALTLTVLCLQARSVLVEAFKNIYPVLVAYCKSDSTALTGPIVQA
jgi:hypothetical protein